MERNLLKHYFQKFRSGLPFSVVMVQEVVELLLCLDQRAPDPSIDDSIVWGEKNAENYNVKLGYEWWKRNSPGITSMMSKNSKMATTHGHYL
ncbi:hypothetical protein QJS10_CPB14g01473 [Acorus calamus]|uniref:Uncharacterized protein n=1 Tax=Acorus calamus TaxID=4465 RepID=A0AAV9DEG2_ACOCL|nr:hypothetical protein QJS10_CPB14g01473 [Acorus calamus]